MRRWCCAQRDMFVIVRVLVWSPLRPTLREVLACLARWPILLEFYDFLFSYLKMNFKCEIIQIFLKIIILNLDFP